MKVAYATKGIANSYEYYSGTSRFIYQELKKQINDLKVADQIKFDYRLFSKLRYRWEKLWGGYEMDSAPRMLDYFKHQIDEQIPDIRERVLISPFYELLDRQSSEGPTILWADYTKKLQQGTLYLTERLSRKCLREREQSCWRVLSNCRINLFASDWAAESAIKDYGIAKEKVLVVPYGSNLSREIRDHELEEKLALKNKESCRLISVSSHWVRKRCDFSIEITKILRKRGIPAILTIFGDHSPRPELIPEYVYQKGFISKKDPEQENLLIREYNQSDFHLFPSQDEAFGVAAVEAASFGVPSIGSDTQGVKTSIQNNQTGIRLDVDSSPTAYADWIESLWSDREKYNQFSKTTWVCYQNYFKYSENIKKIISWVQQNIP